MKNNINIQLEGHFSGITKYLQASSVDLKRSIKSNLIIIAIALQIIISIPKNSSAQDLSNLSKDKNKNFDFAFKNLKDIEVKPHMFDRLTINLDHKYSLFNKQVFFDLQNFFKKEVVLYSLNDKLNFDVLSQDYSSISYSTLKIENRYSDIYLYDLENYKFSHYLSQTDLIFDNFIKNVERNQFFYDMDTKHNDIYTNEFSILDFQSAQADQYINGSKIWGGTFVGMFGVLMLMPRSVTKWEEGYIDDAISNLDRAFSEPPVWDEDHWEINYIGHPYAGSLYYNTIRAQGGSMLSSFLFSAFVSTGWEYVYEGVAEQPSIQDLFVTPVAGAILGELIHQATLGMKKNGYSIFEAAFVTIFNPMHVIMNGYK